jgi:hypothetical protein
MRRDAPDIRTACGQLSGLDQRRFSPGWRSECGWLVGQNLARGGQIAEAGGIVDGYVVVALEHEDVPSAMPARSGSVPSSVTASTIVRVQAMTAAVSSPHSMAPSPSHFVSQTPNASVSCRMIARSSATTVTAARAPCSSVNLVKLAEVEEGEGSWHA